MRRSLRIPIAVGIISTAAFAGAVALVAAPANERTLSLHNIHNDETLTITFKRNGKYVPDAIKKLNWIFRDWRKDKATTMDPALFDLIWEMHAELGSKVPVNIISGYRSSETNEMLRKTRGGQAKQSRHILGMAADIQFPDIPLRQLRYSALIRERGGVGYYPTSATPFVHVDTGRVRAWPRLPRMELALLFPSGHTRHMPASGGPIDRDDVKTARAEFRKQYPDAFAFRDLMSGKAKRPVMVADAGGMPRLRGLPHVKRRIAALWPSVKAPSPEPRPLPVTQTKPAPSQSEVEREAPAPKLVAPPRLADRPVRLVSRPADDDRMKLKQLAVLASFTQPPPSVSTTTPITSGNASSPAAPSGREPERVPDADTNPRLAFVAASVAAHMAASPGWASAPAWDADHPDESSYRPFPLAPFLTASASVDDPALAQLVHPDLARTGELFDPSASPAPLRLRPGRQIAHLIWARDGSAGTIALGRLGQETQSPQPDAGALRKVRTEHTRR
ncbi:MAG: DUF882 domain-containing protein [Hyphomicrobiaceae bacterium]